MEGEVSSHMPIRRKISLEMGSVRPSLLAEGDELATGAVLLLSCPVLVQTILACWQGGNKGTCKELCLCFLLDMGAAGRGNWSTGKCVCSVEQLPWNVADAVIKPGEA